MEKKIMINGNKIVIMESIKKVLVNGNDASFTDQNGKLCFRINDTYYQIVNGKVMEDEEKNDFRRFLKKIIIERHNRHFGTIDINNNKKNCLIIKY